MDRYVINRKSSDGGHFKKRRSKGASRKDEDVELRRLEAQKGQKHIVVRRNVKGGQVNDFIEAPGVPQLRLDGCYPLEPSLAVVRRLGPTPSLNNLGIDGEPFLGNRKAGLGRRGKVGLESVKTFTNLGGRRFKGDSFTNRNQESLFISRKRNVHWRCRGRWRTIVAIVIAIAAISILGIRGRRHAGEEQR